MEIQTYGGINFSSHVLGFGWPTMSEGSNFDLTIVPCVLILNLAAIDGQKERYLQATIIWELVILLHLFLVHLY